MVIKGKSIAHAKGHARHLMRKDQNERIKILEIDESAADPSIEAVLVEYQTLAKCLTGAKKGLYIAALSPEKDEFLNAEQWKQAIDMLEQELGLDNQPRTVVLHEKEGAEHVHVVWQRTDIERERVVNDKDNYKAHERASREIEKTFDLKITEGKFTRDKSKPPKEKKSYEQWEHDRAKRSKIDLKEFKAEVVELYHQAEHGLGFAKSLEQKGYYLGRGDKAKNSFMIVTPEGDAFKLNSTLKNVKAREIKAKLSPLTPQKLKYVAQIRLETRNPKLEVIAKEADAIKESFEVKIDALKASHENELKRLKGQHNFENIGIQRDHEQQAPTGVIAFFTYMLGITRRLERDHAAEDRARTARHNQEIDALRQVQTNEMQELKLQRELALHTLDEAAKGEEPALKLRFEVSREDQALYEFQEAVVEHDAYFDGNVQEYDDRISACQREIQNAENQAVKLESREQAARAGFSTFFKDGDAAYKRFRRACGLVRRVETIEAYIHHNYSFKDETEALEKIRVNHPFVEDVKQYEFKTDRNGYKNYCVPAWEPEKKFRGYKRVSNKDTNFRKAMEALIKSPEQFGELVAPVEAGLPTTQRRKEMKDLIEDHAKYVNYRTIRVGKQLNEVPETRDWIRVLEQHRMEVFLDFSDERLAHLRRIEQAAVDLSPQQIKKLSKNEKQNLNFAREHMNDELKRSRADEYLKEHSLSSHFSEKAKDEEKLEPHI